MSLLFISSSLSIQVERCRINVLIRINQQNEMAGINFPKNVFIIKSVNLAYASWQFLLCNETTKLV